MSRLLITLNVGQDDLYAASRPSHARYAAKIGAEHVTLTGRAGWRMICYEKWRYRKFAAAYDRTLVLDTDTWVHSEAPDIFGEVPETHVGLNRVDPWIDRRLFDWRPHFRRVCESQGVEAPFEGYKAYYNSGVWVGSRAHADYWLHPPFPERLPGHWCDEEQWGRRQLFHFSYPVHELDRRWNFQFYLDRDFSRLATTKPWIVHLAGFVAAERKWRLPMLRLLEAYG